MLLSADNRFFCLLIFNGGFWGGEGNSNSACKSIYDCDHQSWLINVDQDTLGLLLPCTLISVAEEAKLAQAKRMLQGAAFDGSRYSIFRTWAFASIQIDSMDLLLTIKSLT